MPRTPLALRDPKRKTRLPAKITPKYALTDKKRDDIPLPKQRSVRHPPGKEPLLPLTEAASCPSSPPDRRPPQSRGSSISRCFSFTFLLALAALIAYLITASRLEAQRLRASAGRLDASPPPIWEKLVPLSRYYGGLRSLRREDQRQVEWPIEDGQIPKDPSPFALHADLSLSQAWSLVDDDDLSQRTECFLDVNNTIRVPSIHHYAGRPNGFPDHAIGSYDVLRLSSDLCTDRYAKLSPYGYGYSMRQGGTGAGIPEPEENDDLGRARDAFHAVWNDSALVNFRQVDWARAQQQCYQKNAHTVRAESVKTAVRQRRNNVDTRDGENDLAKQDTPTKDTLQDTPQKDTLQDTPQDQTVRRSAVVIRVSDSRKWSLDDTLYLRSLLAELSLASRGRYDVHLLLLVEDTVTHPIWTDSKAYQRRIRRSFPPEFHGLVTLWSHDRMKSIYPGIRDPRYFSPASVSLGYQMPLQHFAIQHPEYDFFWQWDMDIRYTGHHLPLFASLEAFGRRQPRKLAWERSARFYVPTVHGSWEAFQKLVQKDTEQGPAPLRGPNLPNDGTTAKSSSDGTATRPKRIWGSEPPTYPNTFFPKNIFQDGHGSTVVAPPPTPPTTYGDDRFQWGVGHEADLITLHPIDNPVAVGAEHVTGYERPDEAEHLPLRASASTARFSRSLLLAMHRETAVARRHAAADLWPATVALHHGYKAIYAPVPVYLEHSWPPSLLERSVNSDSARPRPRPNAKNDSLQTLSWSAEPTLWTQYLYAAWLGLRTPHTRHGGSWFEETQRDNRTNKDLSDLAGGEGRLCLPPMLLRIAENPGIPSADSESIIAKITEPLPEYDYDS